MPMMEKATENFLFRVSRRTVERRQQPGETQHTRASFHLHLIRGEQPYLCRAEGCTSRLLESIVGRRRMEEKTLVSRTAVRRRV